MIMRTTLMLLAVEGCSAYMPGAGGLHGVNARAAVTKISSD